LGPRAKWEYFRVVYVRYREAVRESKHLILNDFCLNTGYHRTYAIRLLSGPPPGRGPQPRKPQRVSYGHHVVAILASDMDRFWFGSFASSDSRPRLRKRNM